MPKVIAMPKAPLVSRQSTNDTARPNKCGEPPITLQKGEVDWFDAPPIDLQPHPCAKSLWVVQALLASKDPLSEARAREIAASTRE